MAFKSHYEDNGPGKAKKINGHPVEGAFTSNLSNKSSKGYPAQNKDLAVQKKY